MSLVLGPIHALPVCHIPGAFPSSIIQKARTTFSIVAYMFVCKMILSSCALLDFAWDLAGSMNKPTMPCALPNTAHMLFTNAHALLSHGPFDMETSSPGRFCMSSPATLNPSAVGIQPPLHVQSTIYYLPVTQRCCLTQPRLAPIVRAFVTSGRQACHVISAICIIASGGGGAAGEVILLSLEEWAALSQAAGAHTVALADIIIPTSLVWFGTAMKQWRCVSGGPSPPDSRSAQSLQRRHTLCTALRYCSILKPDFAEEAPDLVGCALLHSRRPHLVLCLRQSKVHRVRPGTRRRTGSHFGQGRVLPGGQAACLVRQGSPEGLGRGVRGFDQATSYALDKGGCASTVARG
jgi:hypothetical protein